MLARWLAVNIWLLQQWRHRARPYAKACGGRQQGTRDALMARVRVPHHVGRRIAVSRGGRRRDPRARYSAGNALHVARSRRRRYLPRQLPPRQQHGRVVSIINACRKVVSPASFVERQSKELNLRMAKFYASLCLRNVPADGASVAMRGDFGGLSNVAVPKIWSRVSPMSSMPWISSLMTFLI